MRHIWCLPAIFLSGAMVYSQPTPPKTDPNEKYLDAVLYHWEKAMLGIDSLQAQIKRKTVNPVFQTADILEGEAKFLKSKQKGQNSSASVFLKNKKDPKNFEKLVISGNSLFQFRPQSKTILVHEMPAAKNNQIGNNSILGLIFGMGAKAAKKRYHMRYIPPKPGDDWYYYVQIKPKLAADKVDFSEARLVLFRKTFMPRQLWFREANGKEITWDFPKIQTNVALKAADFAAPRVPSGWRLIRADEQKPPPFQPPNK